MNSAAKPKVALVAILRLHHLALWVRASSGLHLQNNDCFDLRPARSATRILFVLGFSLQKSCGQTVEKLRVRIVVLLFFPEGKSRY